MSILVISADEAKASSICSELTALGQDLTWQRTVGEARTASQAKEPLVVVADPQLEGFPAFADEVRASQPWTRFYLMQHAVGFVGGWVLEKPLDPTAVAALLRRECELAEHDRGRFVLEAQAADLAELVEASFEAIVGLSAEGVVRSWNRGAETIYGYSREEMIGKPLAELNVEAATRRALTAETGQAREVHRRRKDGREIVVLASVSPLSTSTRAGLAFGEVSLDVTASRELSQELEHAERLAAIGRIAASMAHEINNPLTVIRASVEAFGEEARNAADQDLTEAVEDAVAAMERIEGFVQHVCGFARRGQSRLSDLELADTVELALRMVRIRAAEHGVSLSVRRLPETRVPHDPPRLAQAIVNVVANAVDAAALGGGNVELEVLSVGGEIVVAVEDDGPGVPALLGETVFEPFVTTKPHGKGTGLGLAITREILTDHLGTVELLPRKGGGTRAEIRLSAFAPEAHAVGVCETDIAVSRVMAAELRRQGFQVVMIENAEQAQAGVEAGQFEVLVSGDGLLISQLQVSWPGLRCLYVTADPLATSGEGCAVLHKPWLVGALSDAVRSLCVS